MQSGWELLEAGHYKAAIERFREEAKQHNIVQDANIALAYLGMGDHVSARDVCRQFIGANPKRRAGYYALAGIAEWLGGRYADAVDIWLHGLDCEYADFAGGMEIPLLLYFGAVRRPETYPLERAQGLIRAALRHPYSNNWPGPIGAFLVAQIDEQKLRQEANVNHPLVRRQKFAQLEFYLGTRALQYGNRNRYYDHLARCANTEGVEIVHEWYLARSEIALRGGG